MIISCDLLCVIKYVYFSKKLTVWWGSQKSKQIIIDMIYIYEDIVASRQGEMMGNWIKTLDIGKKSKRPGNTINCIWIWTWS